MQSLSPKKRNTISSPVKTARESKIEETVQTLADQNNALQFQIGERDVEVERMKTTLFALNEKLTVLEDVEKDITETRQNFKSSEATRGELQAQILSTGEKITAYKSEYDQKLAKQLSEIDQLKAEIQNLKKQMADKENAHLVSVENLNKKHMEEVEARI